VETHRERSEGWRNGKHQAQWFSSLELHAFPAIGNLTVDEVDAPQIRDLLQPIWLSKPETARRVLQRIGTVLDGRMPRAFVHQGRRLDRYSKD
jgi:integrase